MLGCTKLARRLRNGLAAPLVRAEMLCHAVAGRDLGTTPSLDL